MILAGRLPSLLIPRHLSPRNFTSLSNYLTIAAFLTWSSSRSTSVWWAGLALLTPSMERRAASSTLCTELAIAKGGFGKGEFQGLFANWRALCVAAGPLMYGGMYSKFGKTYPGAPYLAGAVVTGLAELIFRAIPEDELSLSLASNKTLASQKTATAATEGRSVGRGFPVRSSPVRSSPVRSSPVRSSPVRSSPVRSSPVRSSPRKLTTFSGASATDQRLNDAIMKRIANANM